MLCLRKCLIAASRPPPSLLVKTIINNNDDEEAEARDSPFLNNAKLWRYGLLCGLCNTFGSALQQYGLVTVSAGKVAFLTSLYMIILPVFECDNNLSRQLRTFAAACLATVGVYLLSGCAETDVCIGGSLGLGEAAVLASLFFWVTSILASDRAADDPEVNEINLTTLEFGSSAVMGLALAWWLEPESFAYPWLATQQALVCIVAVGVTEAAGFTLCILGQRSVGVSRASLLLSLEGAMTALIGYLVLGEMLTPIEVVGAALMFAATTITSAEAEAEAESEASEEAVAGLGERRFGYQATASSSSHGDVL